MSRNYAICTGSVTIAILVNILIFIFRYVANVLSLGKIFLILLTNMQLVVLDQVTGFRFKEHL